MAKPSTLIPNLNEIVEEHAQPEWEIHLEPTEENRASEQPEVQPVARQQRKKGKEGIKKKKKMSSSQMKPFLYGRSTMQARDL